MNTNWDAGTLRQQFPALQQSVAGLPAIFLDGPGGTQTPRSVIQAMVAYLEHDNSNSGGPFITSRHTDELVQAARQAVADFLGAARPEEIVFGPNMTSLTLAMSRAISRQWQEGDEVVVTRLDHDANISPWLLAAADRGVTVRWLDFDPADCTLALEQLPALLNARTRLVAVTYASNAVGSLTEMARVAEMVHQAGSWLYVDAVHYAPHNLIDVGALDCDFLVCSAYKFFGPHAGILYGKYAHLDRLMAYKVRPAPSQPPGKWESGTQSFEAIAGIQAAIHYLASLGEGPDRRSRLVSAMQRIKEHEMALSLRFLQGAARIPGLRLYGITDIERLAERAPTFAISLRGYSPAALAQKLAAEGIFVWNGHYYAIAVMERLGLLDKGGLVRIGFVHYNTLEEVERLLHRLDRASQEA